MHTPQFGSLEKLNATTAGPKLSCTGTLTMMDTGESVIIAEQTGQNLRQHHFFDLGIFKSDFVSVSPRNASEFSVSFLITFFVISS